LNTLDGEAHFFNNGVDKVERIFGRSAPIHSQNPTARTVIYGRKLIDPG
jgi:hypothetical protein